MPIGRPLEFDPEQVLDAAMQLFWHKGYEATSLQDLLQVMDLSKSSFYQAFGSKHALFQRCIKHYRDTMLTTMHELLIEAQSGRIFIENLLQSVEHEANNNSVRRGCLIMNSASEFAQRDPIIAQLVTDSVNAFVAALQAAIIQGQAQGEISTEKDPASLAHYLLSSLSGLHSMLKAGSDASTLREITQLTLSTLD